jgi:perosamine synthetase
MIHLFDTYIAPSAKEKIADLLASTHISEGALVAEFERALASALGVLNPVAVNSGTSALHLAMVLAGIKPGDEVILPAQTFIASGLVIKYVGATPVFADIEYETGNIDPASIRRKLSDKTKAIMVVHWGGNPCDMREIREIAQQHGIPVIEDAAHALGATYNGESIGTLSEFTCFSFQAIKHVTTGDGGAIACRDEAMAKRARKLRWFDIDRFDAPLSFLGERVYDADEVGYKYHMNNYAAVLGLANLGEFSKRLARRRSLAHSYREHLGRVKGLQLWRESPDRESAYWLFGFHAERRDDFIRAMQSRGVVASVVHQRIDRNSVFGGLRSGLPNQAKFDRTQVHIPVHSSLTDEDAGLIVRSIDKGW